MSLRKELENLGTPRGAPQSPPLRYAPVGMTILFGNAKYSFQDELSSRPERSVAEGSAVRPSAIPNFGSKRRVLTQTLQAVRFHRQDNRGFSSLRDVLFWVVRVMYELKI